MLSSVMHTISDCYVAMHKNYSICQYVIVMLVKRLMSRVVKIPDFGVSTRSKLNGPTQIGLYSRRSWLEA